MWKWIRTAVMRRIVAAGAVVVAVSALALSAVAHERPPGVGATLDQLDPALAGIDVSLAETVASQIIVRNKTKSPLVVLDEAGTPFLHIGAKEVRANVASPAWLLSNDPRGALQPLPRTQARDDDVQWQRVAVGSAWSWFDHRMHPTAAAQDATEPAGDPVDWAIPVRYRGVRLNITGQTVQRQVRGEIVASLVDAPSIAGTTLVVVRGEPPAMLIDSPVPLIVRGAEDEPFLRFRRLDVQANTRSPTWWNASRAYGNVPDGVVDPTAKPRWESVSPVARFQWADPRMAYPAGQPPEAIATAGAAVTLGEWTIPIRVAGEDLTVSGITRWVPLGAEEAQRPMQGLEAGSPVVAALLGLLTAGTAVSAFIRIRRRATTPAHQRQ